MCSSDLQVVKALQNKGCRVEVLAFNNVSSDLKKEADVFTSGYLVPDLLTSDNDITKPWGTEGSRVRGICYNWFADKGYGFMRYLKNINGGLWVTDTRKLDSPYETAFVHESQMSEIIDIHTLPNRDYIFEFTVIKRNDKGYQAIDIKKIHRY